ncbi:MAG: TetR/AcrR family transcriptional regulator [Gemmatimonadota bacterium]
MASDTATDTQPRWHRRPDDRPDEILDAAWAVFAEQGFARARLEDVARRAGVSKGTVYLYFDSKETLFREVIRSKVVTCVLEGEEFVRAHEGPTNELLSTLIARMWQVMGDEVRVQLLRLVHAELPNFPEVARFYFEEVILRSRRMLESVIRRGIERGEFRPVSPEFVARAIPAMVMQLSSVRCFFARYDNYRPSGEEMARAMTDLVLEGLRARTPLAEVAS